MAFKAANRGETKTELGANWAPVCSFYAG